MLSTLVALDGQRGLNGVLNRQYRYISSPDAKMHCWRME